MLNQKTIDRRNLLLGATFRAIVDKGFDSVTLQDIADYSKVSKGVTNYYFKNKDDVFYHLFMWLTDRIYQNEFSAVSGTEGCLNKLRAYVDSAFPSPKKNREFFKVYLEFLAHISHHEPFREVNNRFYANCWSIGRSIITVGQVEGIISTDLDVEKSAMTIRAIIDGCLIQWLMRGQDDLHDYYRDMCYESIANFLTNKSVNKYRAK